MASQGVNKSLATGVTQPTHSAAVTTLPLTTRNHLRALWIASALLAPALQAAPLSVLMQPSPLASLAGYARPMHSRVCGLVLLSEGRADARAAKAAGAQDQAATSMTRLTKAFALLADGREADRNAAREASRVLLGTLEQPAADKSTAVSHCEQWLQSRQAQPDFDKGESAQWSWASQAKLTFDTE